MDAHDAARRTRQEFAAAYRPYVVARLAELGIETPASLDAALSKGERWLADELAAFIETPFLDQRRSPLEIFQEAMKFPTQALAEGGIEPSRRDAGAIAALPGDEYDLAPASSRALGEAAWQAHLAWGAHKAKAFVTDVKVGWLGSNLMDRSQIEPIVKGASLHLERWANQEDVDAALAVKPPVMAIVDLEHPAADAAIVALAAGKVKTVAYGPHVDDVAMMRARSLGADEVHARSRFFRQLSSSLPRLT